MRNVKKIVKRYFRPAVCLVLAAVMLSYSPMAIALNETDAHVVDPSSAGVATAGNTTTVTMNDPSAIINWDTLDTNSSETLQFIKEMGDFYVLNRVSGGATQFDGTLLGNQGHIIIVNPAGIVFGPDALVNAAQFTASSLNMTDDQFNNYLDGLPMVFEDGYGSVINEATIDSNKISLIGKKVLNTGSILSNEGFILMATGDKVIIGSEGSDVMVEIDPVMRNIEDPADLGDVINQGTVENVDGKIILAAGDVFSQALEGNEPLDLSDLDEPAGNVRQEGIIAHHDGTGTLTMSAINEVAVKDGSVTYTEGNVEMSADSVLIEESLDAGGSMDIFANNSVKVINGSELSSGSNMNIASISNAVSLSGNVSSGGDLHVAAGSYISADKDLESENDMLLSTYTDNTYAQGSLKAGGDLTLDTNLNLAGGWSTPSDQSVEAETGVLEANGWIHKSTAGELELRGGYDSFSGEAAVKLNEVTNGGNIYISGNGDVQVKGDISGVEPVDEFLIAKGPVPHNKGGVSIISENGEIYSDSVGIGLEIDIAGYSDEVNYCTEAGPMGVDLPYGEGKAAIVLQSKEDLLISKYASLRAYGKYVAEGQEPMYSECLSGVDNRPDVDFLDADAVIGGYDRLSGEPIDVAIYAGSTAGDVVVGSSDIYVMNFSEPYYAAKDYYYGDDDDDDYYEEYPGMGTVVYDAYDTVEFDFDNYNDIFTGTGSIVNIIGIDDDMINNLFDLDYPYYRGSDYRVEVCSRTTEWLGQAIENGTLPYADDPEYGERMFYGGYVLRGAGTPPYTEPRSSYPRAWVLEDQPPVVADAAPLAVIEEPVIEGCPVQMDAVAAELGINSGKLQIAIGSSLALNPNVQPCDACGRLIDASYILRDPDGSRFAALTQVFNNLAPANVPFTAQTSAEIVTAFNQMSAENPQYALASEYIDAFVEYVAVLDQDLGAPVGNSVAYAMEKHGSAISSSPNGNIGAFLLSRLESFGE